MATPPSSSAPAGKAGLHLPRTRKHFRPGSPKQSKKKLKSSPEAAETLEDEERCLNFDEAATQQELPTSAEEEPSPALKLLKVLKSREAPDDRKIQLAFNFVMGRQRTQANSGGELLTDKEWAPLSYTISFLADWIQTMLINSSKPQSPNSVPLGQGNASSARLPKKITHPAYLDGRCWTIFKWCLVSGAQHKVGTISPGIMRPITCLLIDSEALLDCLETPNSSSYSTMSCGDPEGLFKVVLDVVELLLCAYEGSFRPNLDLWVSSVSACLKIAHALGNHKLIDVSAAESSIALIKLILLLCRGFDRFVRLFPNPRKTFQAVVDKLLEGLLSIRSFVSVSEGEGMNPYSKKLLNVIEDILKHSLFHPSHVRGYSNVCKVGKEIVESCNEVGTKDLVKTEDQGTLRRVTNVSNLFLSYHKLLFQQLEHLRQAGKICMLGSLAWICRAYILELRAQGTPMSKNLLCVKGSRAVRNASGNKDGHIVDKDCSKGSTLSAEKVVFQEDGKDAFLFFEELLSPLAQELQACIATTDVALMRLHVIKPLLVATNDLLGIAKNEHLYMATEDSDNKMHLEFLKRIFTIFILYGISLPKFYTVDKHAQWSEKDLPMIISILKEVITGISYILELEYRVLEGYLIEIWNILLAATALSSLSLKVSEKYEAQAVSDGAVCLASKMIEVFAELRQIDRPTLSLCSAVRDLSRSKSLLAPSFPVKHHRKAIKAFLLSPKFLKTIATCTEELPEGQVSSITKLLADDIELSLQLAHQFGTRPAERCYRLQQAVLRGLTEIYLCMLDHENITSSNSVLVGMALRTLMTRVISPWVGLLVDAAVLGGDIVTKYLEFLNSRKHSQIDMDQITKKPSLSKKISTQCGNASEEVAILLVWDFLLRLYISVRTLHRQCISLMPPKMARKSSIAMHDPVMSFFTGDFLQMDPVPSADDFFSCAAKGPVPVLDVLNNVQEWLEERDYKNIESFCFTLQCIAMHSLIDLRRQLKATKFMIDQSESKVDASHKLDDIISSDCLMMTRQLEKKKFQKYAKKLMRKAFCLTNLLLRGVLDVHTSNSDKDTSNLQEISSSKPLEIISYEWDRVVGSLSSQSLPVGKWGLLCQNIDAWSDFAQHKDLRAFLQFITESMIQGKEKEGENCTVCSVFSFTKELLENDLFYEQKPVREVFPDFLYEELEQKVFMLRKHHASIVTDDLKECFVKEVGQELFISIENEVGLIGRSATMESEVEIRNKHWLLQNRKCKKRHKKSREGPEIQEELGWNLEDQKENIDKCIELLQYISRLPKRFIEAKNAAKFISLLLKLEKLLVAGLLEYRRLCLGITADLQQSGSSSVILCTLRCKLACRRVLESLLLNNEEDSTTEVMLSEAQSMCWPLLSMHAVEVCIYDIFKEHKNNHALRDIQNLLFSLLQSTLGLFTFYSQNWMKSLLSSFLLTTENTLFSGSHSTGMYDMSPLLSMLTAQASNCFEFAKVVKLELLMRLSEPLSMEVAHKAQTKKDTINERIPYGTLASLAAVSSILWSITGAVESLDEICHSDKTSCTKWLGQFPEPLLQFIKSTEKLLIACTRAILLLDEDSSNGNLNLFVDEDAHERGDRKLPRVLEGELFTSGRYKTEVNQKHEVNSSWEQDFQAGCESSNSSDGSRDGSENGAMMIDLIDKSGASTVNVSHSEKFASVKSSAEFLEMSDLQVSCFRECLSGNQARYSYFVGDLFMAIGALVRLRSLFHSPNVVNDTTGLCSHLWPVSMSLHVGAAVRILSEACSSFQTKDPSWSTLLLGAIKYIESVGSFLPFGRPAVSSTAFVKLIQTKMSFLGSLLSSDKMIQDKRTHDELKLSIQCAFTMVLKQPLGLHLRLALQTIERCLLGHEEGSSERALNTAVVCNTKLNGSVIAGLEFLLITLDAVSGPRRLQILAKHSSNFLAALLSLLTQSQRFLCNFYHSRESQLQPHQRMASSGDAEGSKPMDVMVIILKCVDIFRIIVSREVIFPMKANHIAQAMVCPANLFKPFYQRHVQISGLECMQHQGFLLHDSCLCVKLLEIYTSCCRLQRDLLRHRKWESGHCIALLGESIRALLFFLEVLQVSKMDKQCDQFWNMHLEVDCANWLRRVYEEISEHKDTLGKYCSHMLSDYICITSGYGISAGRLSREVKDALRPGAYALMDACSADDLQQLHAVLGEGPRRTALMALRHDYEQHFKYTGKV